MKITHNKVGQNLNLSDSARADKSEKAKAKSAIDLTSAQNDANVGAVTGDASAKVDVSSRARDIQHAKEIAMSAAGVDQSKVEKFQKLIDEGKYKVDSKAVAERMVDEHLLNAGNTSND